MKLHLTDEEAYTLAYALDDAILAQGRAADVFRTCEGHSPEHRELLARSCEDRAQVLRQIRAKVDA